MTDPPATPAHQDEAEARRAIAAAVERAADGRRVLVVFGADWCGDSTAFEASFVHPLVAPLLAAGFEVVRLDVGPREHHRGLATGWGLDYAAGIPTVAVLDAAGELVAATRAGELRHARTLAPVEIATLLHRWLPDAVRA